MGEFPAGAPSPFWWFTCTGTNPTKTMTDAFKTPLDSLEDFYTACKDGTANCGGNAGGCDATNLGLYLDSSAITGGAYTAKMQKTVFDFTELFQCENLNKVVTDLMHKGVCGGDMGKGGLIETWVWLF